jgi:hypothetical protein
MKLDVIGYGVIDVDEKEYKKTRMLANTEIKDYILKSEQKIKDTELKIELAKNIVGLLLLSFLSLFLLIISLG